ncbi:MAG: hypothetical protein ACRER2_07610, partial [Methylococcales bacterium]
MAREACESLPETKQARYFPNLAYILHSLKTRLFARLVQRAPHDQVLELIELYSSTLELNRPIGRHPDPKIVSTPNPGGSIAELNLTAV